MSGLRELRKDLNELRHLDVDVLTRTNIKIASRPGELTAFIISKLSLLVKLYQKRSILKDIQMIFASVKFVKDLINKFKDSKTETIHISELNKYSDINLLLEIKYRNNLDPELKLHLNKLIEELQ